MNMEQYFRYESTHIPIDEVLKIDERILIDLYVKSDVTDQFNVFFHLQNEYFYLINNKRNKEAAHVCYLISYYLFMPLTPPNSAELAEEFAKIAISLDNSPKYLEWLDEVKRGN